MSAQVRCTGCGASVASDEARCSYCGATLVGAPAAPPPEPYPAAERAERFRRVRESAGHERLLAWRPTSSGPTPALVSRAIFGLVFAGFAGGMIAFAHGFPRGGAGVPFLLVPGLFIVIGLGMSVASLVKLSSFRNAPLRAFDACVVAKRSHAVGSKNGVRTEYFVAVETPDGRRHEYAADGSVFGVVGEGDMGVAHVRENYLLGFRPVDA